MKQMHKTARDAAQASECCFCEAQEDLLKPAKGKDPVWAHFPTSIRSVSTASCDCGWWRLGLHPSPLSWQWAQMRFPGQYSLKQIRPKFCYGLDSTWHGEVWKGFWACGDFCFSLWLCRTLYPGTMRLKVPFSLMKRGVVSSKYSFLLLPSARYRSRRASALPSCARSVCATMPGPAPTASLLLFRSSKTMDAVMNGRYLHIRTVIEPHNAR